MNVKKISPSYLPAAYLPTRWSEFVTRTLCFGLLNYIFFYSLTLVNKDPHYKCGPARLH